MAEKTVLILTASRFQFQVWQSALISQKIAVIGGASNARVPKILEELEIARIPLPDLLLIDFDLDNPYDICRWCRSYHPDLKIVLISSNRKTISSTERRWAIRQGANDFLVAFQPQNLLSSVREQVSRVLKILDCPPVDEISLVPALLDFCKDPIAPSRETQVRLQQDHFTYSSGRIIAARKDDLLDTNQNDGESDLARTNFNFPSLMSFLLAVILFISLFTLIIGRIQFSANNPQQKTPSTAQLSQKTKSATTFQQVKGVPTGIFNYGGSTTWVPILNLVNPQIHQAYPQLKLRYSHPLGKNPGSSTGIERLLEGQIDFAVSSRPLKPQEYTRAKQQGFNLSQHQVAIDGIAVAVNHSLPIDGISIESLKQIYLGQVTNWSQLGGPNLEIVPISRRPEVSGTVEFFQDAVLEGKNFDSKVNYQYSTTEAIRQVNSIPGAIYYGTASEIIPQCTVKPLSVGLTEDNLVAPYEDKLIPPSQCPQKRNRVNQQAFIDGDYPITRNLFVIVERNGERQERIGEAYVKLLLSSEGQSLVEKAGFVPVE